MKIMPILALATCSFGLLSAAPAAHAQLGWSLSTIVPAQGSPVQNSSGGGTGSANSGGVMTLGPGSTYTANINATANASGSAANRNPSADYEINELFTYQWRGSGTPATTFHVNVTPTATASGTTGASSAWSADSSGSTTPGSIAANAITNHGGYSLPQNNNPGSFNYQFNPNGATSASWTVDAVAQANGTVYGLPGSFSGTATASVLVNAPTP